MPGSGRFSLQVQLEQPGQDLVVTEVRRPTVGSEDGRIERSVGIGEPRRTLVVEVRKSPDCELRLAEQGRVEPAVAELDERRADAAITSRWPSVGRGKGNVSKQVVGV